MPLLMAHSSPFPLLTVPPLVATLLPGAKMTVTGEAALGCEAAEGESAALAVALALAAGASKVPFTPWYGMRAVEAGSDCISQRLRTSSKGNITVGTYSPSANVMM